MSVALPSTIALITLCAGVLLGRWFRVGVLALVTLGLITVAVTVAVLANLPVWENMLCAIGLSCLLQCGYLSGAVLLDIVASQNADGIRASLGPT